MPQLAINQGPQDALLFDNTRSYFTNVGYTRTSNFQVEYRDCDSQNTAAFGSTVNFVIQKAADLLGPVDIVMDLNSPKTVAHANTPQMGGLTQITTAGRADGAAFTQWVDELGFAMIEKATFSIGSNDIETLTGEQMQIRNELMKSDEQRLGYHQVLKTGVPAFTSKLGTAASGVVAANERGAGTTVKTDYTRIIGSVARKVVTPGTAGTQAATVAGVFTAERTGERKLIIPLSFFFTHHVSQYFPLSAIAGCNDVRIAIKFRSLTDLIQAYTSDADDVATLPSDVTGCFDGSPIKSCKLRCHYVHVTGPEAQALASKEHVRLLKLWQHQPSIQKVSATASDLTWDIDLSLLHPVSTLIVTVRKKDDLAISNTEGRQMGGYFFYHGDGSNPNYDNELVGVGTAGSSGHKSSTVTIKSIELTLNGQERHPGLSKGIPVEYLQHRLVPQLHSNSNSLDKELYATAENRMAQKLFANKGSKNIYVYPFSLNPEGSQPSGSVNFSKVSHARLKLHHEAVNPADYQVDVYALYYNWLQIKDGRALLSFA